MDADSICNDFHLRMTVATTEHERFEALLSVLVPTPDTIVSPENLNAINDSRNVLFEAFAAVCQAYDELDEYADELDPDESKVIDDALNTVKGWHEEIDQAMVQIRQVVWDSQHGHIKRLITGTHSRSGKRSFRNPVEEPEAVAVVADDTEEPVEEETDIEYEAPGSEDEEDFVDDPTEEPVESEDVDEADVEGDAEDTEEATEESEEEESVEEESADTDEEEPIEAVIVTEEAEEPVQTEETEEAPVADDTEEPAPVAQESEKAPTATISPEELQRIYQEVYEKVKQEGYNLGAADALAKLTDMKGADETADAIAAESKPLARKPKTTKPKAEAKPAKKPAKPKAPAKKEEAPKAEAKPKKRGLFRKKEASE